MDLTRTLAHLEMDGDMGGAGLPGTGINAGEKATIFAELAALQGKGLADLADTAALGDAPDGKIILRSGGAWILHDLPGSAVWGGVSGDLAAQEDLQAALDAKAAAPHTHSQTLKDVVRASNLSTLSSGTITPVATTITLLAGVVYDIDAMLIAEMYGLSNPDPSVCKLRVTINGNSFTSLVDLTVEAGVDGPKIETHTQTVTGTGADIAISGTIVWVARSIKPWYIQLFYRAEPRR